MATYDIIVGRGEKICRDRERQLQQRKISIIESTIHNPRGVVFSHRLPAITTRDTFLALAYFIEIFVLHLHAITIVTLLGQFSHTILITHTRRTSKQSSLNCTLHEY